MMYEETCSDLQCRVLAEYLWHLELHSSKIELFGIAEWPTWVIGGKGETPGVCRIRNTDEASALNNDPGVLCVVNERPKTVDITPHFTNWCRVESKVSRPKHVR